MGATFARVKTWSSGEVLTAADLNAEYDNVLNNLTPSGMDDESGNAAAMQATADPYPGSVASLATSLQGEIQRLRYLIAQITGKTYWYIDPTGNLEIPGDAELAAIAALVSAADKLPYFTGSGSAALADFTAVARTLLDDTTLAAMRTTLELGALALLNSVAAGQIDTDAVGQDEIAASAVGQGELKTTTGEVSHSGVGGTGSNLTLPGGTYGFYPQIKVDQVDQTPSITGYIGNAYPGTITYATIIYLGLTVNTDSRTAYAQQRYITASGKDHWIFLLIDRNLDKIIAAYQAPDHPCYGNGDDPDFISHPFADYWNKPLPAGLEIIVLDMDSIKEIKNRAKIKKCSILDVFQQDKIEFDFAEEIPWIARDIDGKRNLNQPNPIWKHRKIKR